MVTLGAALKWNIVVYPAKRVNPPPMVQYERTFIMVQGCARQLPEVRWIRRLDFKRTAFSHDYEGNGETLLVVDDSIDQRQIATKRIKQLGYIDRCTESGENAVELLRNQKVDLLILDMIMDPSILQKGSLQQRN